MKKALTIGLVLCIMLSLVVIQAGAEEGGDVAPNAALVIENANVGSSKITLIHHGGDTIVDAFKEDAPYWNSLEVRINGAIYTGTVKLNGATVSAGDFKPGDELELSLDWELSSGDSISVVYTPTGDLLQRVTVSWGVSEAPNAALVIENANVGSSKITLIHHGGDTIVDAFKGNAPYWNSLGVRINGSIYTGTVKLNGATVSAGDFKPGDELELSLDWELSSGDSISVVYTPTGDLLQRVTVSLGVSEAPNAALVVENANAGSSKITLIHHGGDTIVDAFKEDAPYWNSLEVRINGAIYTGTVKLNGATVSAGDFKPGDELELSLGWELSGDETITVVYTPTGDVLQRVKVTGPVTPTPTPITPTPTISPTPSPVTPSPTPSLTPTGEPELSISQSSLKEEPKVGEEVLITVAILNKGKATAKNIHIEEQIPSSIAVSYVEGADKAGGLVYWNGELEPGEAHSITHTLRILEEKSRTIPVTVTYEDAYGKEKQKSTEIYLTAEIEEEETPTPSPLANLPWVYIIILVAVILVGLAIIVAVRRGGEGGGAEVTIEESK